MSSPAVPKLSTERFAELLAERCDRASYIELCGYDISELDLAEHPKLEKIVFGKRDAQPAVLGRLDLGEKTLIDCSFCRVELRETNLRGSTLIDCDFRYARFFGATLQDTQITSCDFYRAYFAEGTVLVPEVLRGSSLTRASLGGIVDLRKQHVEPRRGMEPAFAQEQTPQEYARFLEHTVVDRFERNPGEGRDERGRRNRADDLKATINARYDEAAVVYRRLAALWTSQGAYTYAGWAYVRGKRMERRHANPFRPACEVEYQPTGAIVVTSRRPRLGELFERGPMRERSLPRWLGLWLADLFCAFGEGLAQVFGSILLLVIGFGVAYASTDGLTVGSERRPAGLGDSLLFSLTEVVNAAPGRFHASNGIEIASGVQTLLGVVLLGLLGFVVGNKLHSA
jgi:Pentapeptide repeats (9 copies)